MGELGIYNISGPHTDSSEERGIDEDRVGIWKSSIKREKIKCALCKCYRIIYFKLFWGQKIYGVNDIKSLNYSNPSISFRQSVLFYRH